KKRFTAEGGHRAASPQETFERYKHHISPITGVVSELKRLEENNQSGLVYSFSAGHNFATITDDLFFLRVNVRGRSGGKGLSEIQAKVSGLCEAIERYSGVSWGDEIALRDSYAALKPQAVHPNECMLFSEEQYQNREGWNAAQPQTRRHVVPEPFDEDMPIDWTPAWSLTQNNFRYLPSAYCYYGHPDLKSYFSMLADSNGNAAGNTIEEAILQGFMELVERDCVGIWWYNQIRCPAVDLDSFDLPYLHRLREYYAKINRELWVVDLTNDLSIPAFVGVSRRTDRPVEDIIFGFGAHFDPKIAVLRALTEVNQFLPCVSKTKSDGSTFYWFHDWEAIKWWRNATIESKPYLAPDPALPAKKLSDYAPYSCDDLRDDVLNCIEIARRHNLEMLIVDQTRPDIELSVVKVIVPGLRHFWRRLGPGRLYEVPVKLGWRKDPLSETQVNDWNIFF
nr:adenylate cyclase [Anaerolineales bacterium]